MRRRILLAGVVVLLVAACELGVRVPAPATCRSDFDCATTDVCTLGVCVQVAPPDLVLDLALTPPNDSGYLKQQVANIQVAAGTAAPDLALVPTVVFSGRVLMEGEPGQVGLRARVEAQRPGEIPGTYLRASAVTVADPISGKRQFRLQVVPGRYEIVVFSEEMGLPPLRLAGSLDIDTSREKDLVLPPAASFRRLQGRVVQSEGDLTPIVGAQVQALDVGGVVVSTVRKTSADGRFEVTVPPGDSTYTIQVSRSEANPQLPTVTRTGIVVQAAVADAGTIAMGAYPAPRLFSGTVSGAFSGGSHRPVAGAQVQLVGSVGNGSWTEGVTTNDTGAFEAFLPPSTYAIEIRPPQGSEFALHLGTVRFEPGVRGEWVLPPKARLSGQVAGPDGTPVSGVFVRATRRSGIGSDPDRIQYVTSTNTDASGVYSLRLDRGVYDLLFVPEGKPLARTELTNFAVASDELRHDQRLPIPAVIAGKLRRQNGEPFPGVTVEAYLHSPTASAVPRLVGTGVTDAAGRYRVVIPANPF